MKNKIKTIKSYNKFNRLLENRFIYDNNLSLAYDEYSTSLGKIYKRVFNKLKKKRVKKHFISMIKNIDKKLKNVYVYCEGCCELISLKDIVIYDQINMVSKDGFIDDDYRFYVSHCKNCYRDVNGTY